MDERLEIQRLYPQVYLACHARHTRSRARSREGVSERDQSLLAHLSPSTGTRPSELARHLGVGLSTVSEAAKRLERQGLVARARGDGDGRSRALVLTERGAEALRGASVLDDERLGRALALLSASERRAAVRGLGLLARACREARLAEASR